MFLHSGGTMTMLGSAVIGGTLLALIEGVAILMGRYSAAAFAPTGNCFTLIISPRTLIGYNFVL